MMLYEIGCLIEISNTMVNQPLIAVNGKQEFTNLQKAKHVRQILQNAAELAGLDMMSFEIYSKYENGDGDMIINSAGQDV